MSTSCENDRSGFAERLAAIRQRRKRLLIPPLVFIGGCIIIMVTMEIAASNNTKSAAFTAMATITAIICVFAWIGTLVSLVQMNLARCPRCDKRYFRTWWCNWPFAKRCLHCGLSIHARFDPDPAKLFALLDWLKRPQPRGAIPDVGLSCDNCGYLLGGLTSERCPECGREFSVAAILDEATSQILN